MSFLARWPASVFGQYLLMASPATRSHAQGQDDVDASLAFKSAFLVVMPAPTGDAPLLRWAILLRRSLQAPPRQPAALRDLSATAPAAHERDAIRRALSLADAEALHVCREQPGAITASHAIHYIFACE